MKEIENYKESVKKILASRENIEESINEPMGSIPQSVQKEIEDRKKELENEAFAQDIKLKGSTLKTLFKFLTIETGVIFIFTFMQATNVLGFKLEEWSFKILISATITQITIMLLVAVKHLFPSEESKTKK